MTRLAGMGVVNARQACDTAKNGCQCNPEHAMALIDFAVANGKGPGAIVWRFSRSVPSMPVESGWPQNGEADAMVARDEKAMARKRREQRDSDATQIIKQGRKSKKPDEEIMAELVAAGLEWPK